MAKEYIETIKPAEIVRVVNKIRCNKCGRKIDNYKFQECVHTKAYWGYGSQIFGDLTTLEYDLCEKCVSELVGTFKIPPEIGEYNL